MGRPQTKEELLKAIDMHTANGATIKVSILKQRMGYGLIGVWGDPDAEIPEETKEEFKEISAKEPESHDGDRNEASEEAKSETVYELHANGLPWKTITSSTGVKVPWLKAKAYAKANNLPYPAQ